tara:strand:- start:121 stop:387 length:267 start_codon:yes stop_codon:yes gene_type:complete
LKYLYACLFEVQKIGIRSYTARENMQDIAPQMQDYADPSSENQVHAVRTEVNHHYRLVTQFLLRSLQKIHHQAIRWNLVDFILLKFQH